MSSTVDGVIWRCKLTFQDCTYPIRKFGSNSFTEFPATTGIGYVGRSGSGLVGSDSSRNQTDPAGPKNSGKFPGLTVEVTVRPWFEPQMLIGMFMPSRTVAIEYPLRNTVPSFPKIHESTGAFTFGMTHANPSEGEKLFQLVL